MSRRLLALMMFLVAVWSVAFISVIIAAAMTFDLVRFIAGVAVGMVIGLCAAELVVIWKRHR